MFAQNAQINLFVVDSEELSRTGFCLLFDEDQRICIVGSAPSIDEAMTQLEHVQPDVIVIKAQTNGEHLIEPIQRLKVAYPSSHLLVILETIDSAAVTGLVE